MAYYSRLHQIGTVFRLMQAGKCTGYVYSRSVDTKNAGLLQQEHEHVCLLLSQLPSNDPTGFWGVHQANLAANAVGLSYVRVDGAPDAQYFGFNGATYAGPTSIDSWFAKLQAFDQKVLGGTQVSVGYGLGFTVATGANQTSAFDAALAFVDVASRDPARHTVRVVGADEEAVRGCIDPGTGKVAWAQGDIGLYGVQRFKCVHQPACTAGNAKIVAKDFYRESFGIPYANGGANLEFPVDNKDKARTLRPDGGVVVPNTGVHYIYRYAFGTNPH